MGNYQWARNCPPWRWVQGDTAWDITSIFTVPVYDWLSQIPDPGAPMKIVMNSEILGSQNLAAVLPDLPVHYLEIRSKL